MKRSIRLFTISALAAGVAACGGGGSSSDSTGTASFALTDAAVDSVNSVNITVVAVELKPRGGKTLSFDVEDPESLENINLLDLQHGTIKTLLNDQELPAGEYEWIRLKLGDESTFSVVNDQGAKHDLFIPSGSTRGLQTSGFVVPEGGMVDFTIDFDVRKSLIAPPGLGSYLLKPVLRLVDNSDVGTIAGSIDSTLLSQACEDAALYAGAVYVYEGHGVTPDDLGSQNEPLVAVPVDTTTYDYQASFLPSGDYTISYSCDMDERQDADGNLIDENLTFIPPEGFEVSVQSSKTTEVDFD